MPKIRIKLQKTYSSRIAAPYINHLKQKLVYKLFLATGWTLSVRRRVIEDNDLVVDETSGLHQLRWLGHALSTPSSGVPRQAIIVDKVDWKEAKSGKWRLIYAMQVDATQTILSILIPFYCYSYYIILISFAKSC